MVWVPAWWVLVKALFLACRYPSSHCILTWEGKAENENTLVFLLLLLVREFIPSWGSAVITSSKSNYLPKIPPPNTITLGIRISPYELGEGDIKSRSDVEVESPAAVPPILQCVAALDSMPALGKNPH